ncbi:MAG: hypothetical protein U0R78_00615 [Nocardioidaceae bacterium]
MVGPQIARLHAAGRPDQAGLALRTATTWNVLIAWPVYLTCAVIPATLLLIFGKDYSEGVPVVIILALGMLVGIAAGPVDIALLMLGRSVLSLRNNMAAPITNLVLNLALVPVLGISGGARLVGLDPGLQRAAHLADPPDPGPALRPRDLPGRRPGRRPCSSSHPPPPACWPRRALASLGASFLGGLVYLGLGLALRRPLHVHELTGVFRRKPRSRRRRLNADVAAG